MWIEAAGFNSGCVGDSACPGAGRYLLLPGADELSYTAVCALITAARCPPYAERSFFVTGRKKIHFRNTGEVS